MALRKEEYARLKQALSRHPGALHRALGVAQGRRIPENLLTKALHSRDPHVRRMATLAKTARGFAEP